MTFYLKALKQKFHYPCEMTDNCAFTKVLYVCGLAIPRNYSDTCDSHFLATLLTYAFDQTKGLLQTGQVYQTEHLGPTLRS